MNFIMELVRLPDLSTMRSGDMEREYRVENATGRRPDIWPWRQHLTPGRKKRFFKIY